MVDISKGTVLTSSIVAAFIGVVIILGFLIWSQSNNLKSCVNFQNSHCAVIMCNGDSTDAKAPSPEDIEKAGLTNPNPNGDTPQTCFPYAFRDIRDKDGILTGIECDYPFSGIRPLNIDNK